MKYDLSKIINMLYLEYSRLPSGFGTVRFLGHKRSNPYAVHPPIVMADESGWKRPPAICYVSDKKTGYKILALYHEGLYSPGMERDATRVERMFLSLIKKSNEETCTDQITGFSKTDPLLYHQKQQIHRLDYASVDIPRASPIRQTSAAYTENVHSQNSYLQYIYSRLGGSQIPDVHFTIPEAEEILATPSLKEVYRAFIEYKYGKHASRRLSHSSRNASEAAFRKLKPFYDRPLDDISIVDLQNLVNRTAAEGYSRSTISDLVTLIHQLYRFAFPREMCTKEYGKYVQMPYTDEERHHQDFNDLELGILWEHKDDPMIGMILIMCYSGFRISAFAPENGMRTFITADGTRGYFRGGIKTKAGKDRLVPIHSSILPLVKGIVDDKGKAVYLCGKTTSQFRKDMKKKLIEIGIDSGEALTYNSRCTAVTDSEPDPKQYKNNPRHHTPHSCRHTFSRLCESYGVNEADRRRMLGHAFGNDITNGVYGHRSVEELSAELEKIRAPAFHRASDL